MHIFQKEFGYGEIYRGSFRHQKYSICDHIHQFSEIIYLLEGEIALNVDGVFYTMSAGDIAVITPFQVHSIKTVGVAKFWMCVFSNNCIPDYFNEPEFFNNRERIIFKTGDALIHQINEMLSTCEHPIYLTEKKLPRKIKSVIYSVFSEFVESSNEIKTTKKHDVLSSVLIYTNEHFLENITLASVSKALGYNTKYLSQCLNAIPNMNFPTLLNSLRIDHAKRLLLKTNFKVIDIAYESGFENEQSFHRVFLKITGMTPGEYRNRNV